jgi:hypothetical protein
MRFQQDNQRSTDKHRNAFDFAKVDIILFYVMAVGACSVFSAVSQIRRRKEFRP